MTATVIHPDSKGDVFLSATNAELHGNRIQLDTPGELPDIGYWDKGDEWVSWTTQIEWSRSFRMVTRRWRFCPKLLDCDEFVRGSNFILDTLLIADKV